MNIYRYKAVDPEGNIFKGIIKASNESDALEILGIKNLYLISFARIPKILTPFIIQKKVKNIELIEFAKNLSLMIKAGIPLIIALSDIAENMTNSRFKRVIIDIKELVERGLSFSEAIALHSDVFPSIFHYLIAIGEQTGRLDESLKDLQEHFQKIEDLKTAIKRALIYPVFATVASFGAIGFWIVYVLPKIVSAMKDMGVKIPFITQVLVDTGILLQKTVYFLPLLPVLTLILWKTAKKKKKIKWLLSYLSFKLPIFKNIYYTQAVSLFCEQMRILLSAGIPIDNSLDMTADVVNNEIMREAITKAKERILSGERISHSLKEQAVFPSLVIRLIDVGESSGTLEEQLNFLNNHYTALLLDYSAKLGKIIEPVMIGVIGLFFAIVIVSLLSPLYDLISKLGRG